MRGHALGLGVLTAAALAGGPIGSTGTAAAATPEPRVVYLWFADGGAQPPTSPRLCSGTPAPYRCGFAPTPEECRRQVQGFLDRWYRDFNLVFTYHQPASGLYDTVIVTDEPSWCPADAQSTSRTLLPTCVDTAGGSAVVFQCHDNAYRCASIIAQEHAHLVGLEHTGSVSDVMNPQFVPAHDGFEDRDNAVNNPACRRPQNSFRLMLERLGAWPGGAKPDPAAPPPGPEAGAEPPRDAGEDPAEAGTLDAPAPAGDGAGPIVDGNAPSTDAGPDAALPAPPRRGSGGGCALAGGVRPPAGLALSLLPLLAGLLAALARRRTRR